MRSWSRASKEPGTRHPFHLRVPRAAFSTLRRMRTLLSIAAVLMAAALPAVAIASRAPSHHERAQLRQAIKTSNHVGRSFHRGHLKLAKPRISDSGRCGKCDRDPRCPA